MLFIRAGTNKSRQSHLIRKKAFILSSKFKIGNWERGWSQVTFLNTETPATNFKDEGGIFSPEVFHTIAEAISVIFDLRQQLFADAKSFKLERLGLLNHPS